MKLASCCSGKRVASAALNQVTLRAGRGDIDEAAAYLGIAPRLVRAAVEYYAEFADEVDEDAAVAEGIERDERARWERQRRALA